MEGRIIKLQTEGTGSIFYQIVAVTDSTYVIKALCRVRKGYLTVKYENACEHHLYKSELGVNYLQTTKKRAETIEGDP